MVLLLKLYNGATLTAILLERLCDNLLWVCWSIISDKFYPLQCNLNYLDLVYSAS